MKRCISFLLAVVLVLSIVPATPLIVQAADSGGFSFTYSDGNIASVDRYFGPGGDVIIPSAWDGSTVTGINDRAFCDCRLLTSITIPDSITHIHLNAFEGCVSLDSVYITDIAAWCSIHFEGMYANPFYVAGNLYLNNTLVKKLIIPDGVTYINNYAFCGYDRLTSITIPDSVTSIGDYAFYDCDNLTSITIPDSVTSIGDRAFSNCKNLTSITIPDSVTSISYCAFSGCDSLTSITIPDSVTSIGKYAFSGCDSLTSITIPDSVTSIGDYAFNYCTSLKTVNYLGYRNDRDCIDIGVGNSSLTQAQWIFSVCTGNHIFDNACDTVCNDCGTARIVGDHVYDNACDSACNECGKIRTVPDHRYDNICDTTCNVCGIVRPVPDHIYDDVCDETCNICGDMRTDVHIFDNSCDAECNACHFIRTVGAHSYTENGGLTCSICKYSKAPSAPEILSFTTDSLTLVSADGLEYSADGIHWQDSPTFRDLVNNTQQSFYQRVKASDNALVSEPSAALAVDFRVCTVSYHANGGRYAPDNQIALYSNSIVLTLNKPSREGYKFAGWATKESCGKQYAPGEEIIAIGDLTLYALWIDHCATCQGTGTVPKESRCTCDNGYITGSHTWCSNCGGEDCITFYITGFGGSTSSCSRCGSIGTGHSSTSTYQHSECNGTGIKIIQTTCRSCSGRGTDNPVPAPIISSYTDTTVNLRPNDGYEYSLDGASWQTSNVFTGLSPATKYTFYCRVGATADAPFGLTSNGTSMTTDKSPNTDIPLAPIVLAVTSDSITLETVSGCEYSVNGVNWQHSPTFTNLSVVTTYMFYQRYAATATTYAGGTSEAVSATTDKGSQNAPTAPTLASKTHNQVELARHYGYQYSMDGITWQDSNVFTGLNPSTNYLFYCRLAETDSYYASAASKSLTVRTNDPPANTPGDVNDDGRINSLDGLLLLRHLNSWDITINSEEAMDVNADGKVNSLDGLILMRYLNGWNVTLG